MKLHMILEDNVVMPPLIFSKYDTISGTGQRHVTWFMRLWRTNAALYMTVVFSKDSKNKDPIQLIIGSPDIRDLQPLLIYLILIIFRINDLLLCIVMFLRSSKMYMQVVLQAIKNSNAISRILLVDIVDKVNKKAIHYLRMINEPIFVRSDFSD